MFWTTMRTTQSTSQAEHGCGSHPMRWCGNAGHMDKSLLSSARSKDSSYWEKKCTLSSLQHFIFIKHTFPVGMRHAEEQTEDNKHSLKSRVPKTIQVEALVYVLSFFLKKKTYLFIKFLFLCDSWVSREPVEPRRRSEIPQNWSYRCLPNGTWLLYRIVKCVNLSHWATSAAPDVFSFLKHFLSWTVVVSPVIQF